jgi:hypothetical protein
MALEWNTVEAETERFGRHRRQRPRDSYPRSQYKHGQHTVHLAKVQTTLKVGTGLPFLPHFPPGTRKSENPQILTPYPSIYARLAIFTAMRVTTAVLWNVICYSSITSTGSPSFCVTAFSSSLTNLAALLPQSHDSSSYVSRPTLASPPL